MTYFSWVLLYILWAIATMITVGVFTLSVNLLRGLFNPQEEPQVVVEEEEEEE